jgi:hypothetical protein
MSLLSLRALISNEDGAEIVEWVLWVGGVALLAGVLYATLSTSLNAAVLNFITTGIKAPGS